MTVAQSTRQSGPFTMTEGQTIINYEFPVDNASEIKVLRGRNGSISTLELDVDYGVTHVGEEEGQIILTSGSVAGDKVTVIGDLPIERTEDFPGWRSIPDNAINKSLDRMTKALQEMRRDTRSAMAVDPSTGDNDARGHRVINMADGIGPSDAVTMRQIADIDPVQFTPGLDPIDELDAVKDLLAVWDTSAGHPGRMTPADLVKASLNGAVVASSFEARLSAVFGSRVTAMTAIVPAGMGTIRTNGYAVAGDGGGALYKRAVAEPSHAGKLQTLDGAWWEIASDVISGAMVGGVANAVQAAITTGLALRLVPGENAIIIVPTQSASLAAAVDAIRGWSIPAGASLKISIAAGMMAMGGYGINITHPDGARIYVVGAGKNSTILEWDVSTITGIYVPVGYTLGKIDGLTIQLPTTAGRALGVGLLADQGGRIVCGSDLRVRRFYWNYFSRLNGVIIADGTEGSSAGDANYLAYQGGHISCRGATGTDANDAVNFLGSGCVAEAGGTIDATGATFTGNWLAGITALSDGSIRAGGADSSGNIGSGMLINGGSIEAQNSTRNNNGRYGVEWSQTNGMGWFHGPAASEAGNTLGTISPHVEMFSGTSAGVRATSGEAAEPLRLDAKGAASIYLNAGGATQFEAYPVASAVNRFQAFGAAAGMRVSLTAFGSDANIGADITAKGSGSVRLRSNGAGVVDAYADSNAVNSLGMRARATGGAVAVEALGADTNIDLQLTPKGSGRIKLTSWASSSDAAINGFIEVRDAAGNTRKLATIA